MLVRSMQGTCLDTTSSGPEREEPHRVVEYVDIVTVIASMVHEAFAVFARSRVFSREMESGMCCPGAIFSG
jgi:hypothetical protein